jgi:hypothetical protein
MIVHYAQQQSLRAAIAKTFDGAHACSLCHVVNKAKNSEKKSDLQSPTQKVDLICVARALQLLPPFAPFDYGTFTFSSSEIRRFPPVPPPRLQLG